MHPGNTLAFALKSMRLSGTADLPLHTGKAPRWLFSRMVKLSGAIAEHIIEEYGEAELLRRLSSPHWFQAFSCAIGFDWHSSGTTTTTMGALKEALSPEKHGVGVAGGKGSRGTKTPEELREACARAGEEELAEELIRASRLSFKVDAGCVQDGYQLYHHTMVFTLSGEWCVVQQGMKDRYARRYHWHSEELESFTCEPHTGISAQRVEQRALNLVSESSEEVRRASLELLEESPARLRRLAQGQRSLLEPELRLPARHRVSRVDISERSWRALARLHEIQPESYEELVGLPGVGGRTLRALALLAELIYGTPADWKDPVKYSFAHGGKDGTPYPVDRRTYDRSIGILREALEEARVGRREKKQAILRLRHFLGEG